MPPPPIIRSHPTSQSPPPNPQSPSPPHMIWCSSRTNNLRNSNYIMAMLFRVTNYRDFFVKLKTNSILWWTFFWSDYFFLMGRDGRVDGHQKYPLIFFIFRYIKHYTHIYLYIYIYIKKCPDKFLVGLKFWTSWGSGLKNSKTPSW